LNRESGVLLHLTSLPDGEGIGDLGPSAFAFVDWLVEAGQRWWQVLPCGEVGYGASPYQSQSAYAGNSMLISLQSLIDIDMLDEEQVEAHWVNTDAVDFSAVAAFKEQVLAQVCENFDQRASAELHSEYQAFLDSDEQHWLHDYARFVVLKTHFEGQPWTDWPEEFARRDGAALYTFDVQEAAALERVKVTQFLFACQWQVLRNYANNSAIALSMLLPTAQTFGATPNSLIYATMVRRGLLLAYPPITLPLPDNCGVIRYTFGSEQRKMVMPGGALA